VRKHPMDSPRVCGGLESLSAGSNRSLWYCLAGTIGECGSLVECAADGLVRWVTPVTLCSTHHPLSSEEGVALRVEYTQVGWTPRSRAICRPAAGSGRARAAGRLGRESTRRYGQYYTPPCKGACDKTVGRPCGETCTMGTATDWVTRGRLTLPSCSSGKEVWRLNVQSSQC
jgi:hypothetical protein